MTPQERLVQGERAKIAGEVLGEAFDAVTAGYMARLKEVASTEPWAVDKLRSLALAQQIAESVRAHIAAVAAGANIAEAELRHRRKIERMTPERRRILGL